MKQEIDLINWKRKEHYEFFIQFVEPFWANSKHDCTFGYRNGKG